MKVLYQSDVTGKVYETEQALVAAEKEVSETKKQEELKKQERAAAAKNVETLMSEAAEANAKAREALTEFCEKYGSYKTTIKTNGKNSSWTDWIFDPFKMLDAFL